MHSYLSANGYLQWISRRSKAVLVELKCATTRVGGLEQALRDATSKKAEVEARVTDDVSTPMDTGTPDGDGILIPSFADPVTTSVLRRRLAVGSLDRNADEGQAREVGCECEKDDDPSVADVLAFHPDPLIAGLAKDFLDLDSELVSMGPKPVRWPENVTFRNFAIYQLIPTLVYELEYPRTDR